MLKVKSLQISVLTVQKAYDILQEDGFIETTAGKGCKKIEGCLNDAIEIARMSGILLDKLVSLLRNCCTRKINKEDFR